MSIDAIKRDIPVSTPERSTPSSVTQSSVTPATTSAADPQAVSAAVEALQTHFSSMNPEFSVDYLSGLGVVRMRAANTGEVVFQIPDTEAVQLARLIKEGMPPASVALTKTTA